MSQETMIEIHRLLNEINRDAQSKYYLVDKQQGSSESHEWILDSDNGRIVPAEKNVSFASLSLMLPYLRVVYEVIQAEANA